MAANALTVPLATDIVSRLEKRLLSSLDAFVEEWSDSATALTRWEDEHLIDGATPDALARHKTTVTQLIRIGKMLSVMTSEADVPRREEGEIVTATLQMLQDKLSMWHGGMADTERRRIVDACFS